MRFKCFHFFLILGIILTSCATTSSIKNAPLSEGTAKTYAADYNSVIKATRDAITDAGLDIEETYRVNENSFVIIGNDKAGIYSYGALARTVVTDNQNETVTVRVLTKKRVSVNVTADGDYSKEIFSSLDISLNNAIVSNPKIEEIKAENINNSPSNTPPESENQSNRMNDTEWIQSILNELGYDCGVVDGIMGPNTRSCIRSFQRENGLQETGSVNDATYQRIIDIQQNSESESDQQDNNKSSSEGQPVEANTDDQTSYSSINPVNVHNLSIYVGIGNSLGGFGIQGEKYLSDGKYSIFGGLGRWLGSREVAYALGFRWYSEISNQRYFGEASYSMVAYEAGFPEGIKYYGPGAQIGYQIISGDQSIISDFLPNGYTLLASVGFGYADVPIDSNMWFLFSVSIGYSLR